MMVFQPQGSIFHLMAHFKSLHGIIGSKSVKCESCSICISGYDNHTKCSRCRPCGKKGSNTCEICCSLSDFQKSKLKEYWDKKSKQAKKNVSSGKDGARRCLKCHQQIIQFDDHDYCPKCRKCG